MNVIERILSALVPEPTKPTTMIAKRDGGSGGRSIKTGKAREQMPKKHVMPKIPRKYYADEAFPGQTNYGVPQDNMIDTPMGYLDSYQYDQAVGGRLQGGLRNIQPQAYTNQRLSGLSAGGTFNPSAYRQQMPTNGGFLQSGGVPTYDGRRFEGSYGDIEDYRTRQLRVY